MPSVIAFPVYGNSSCRMTVACGSRFSMAVAARAIARNEPARISSLIAMPTAPLQLRSHTYG